MPRMLRIQNEEYRYLITNRCLDQMFMLTPGNKKVESAFRSCLNRAMKRYNVLLYGAVSMSNHYHLVVQAPRLNLSLFMKDFQSLLAIRLNEIHGRKGVVFPERFRDKIIGDDASLLNCLKYLLLNPINARLVRHPSDWPGFITRTAFEEGDDGLEVTPLPEFESLAKQHAALGPLLENEASARIGCVGVVGARRVKNRRWFDKPAVVDVKRSKKLRTLATRLCCINAAKKAEMLEEVRAWIGQYKAASKVFRDSLKGVCGGQSAEFPHGACPPPAIPFVYCVQVE